jgi:hypothetical protein
LLAHYSSKFVNLLLLLVNSGKQLVELVIFHILLSLLCSRLAYVGPLVFGKPKPPQVRRSKSLRSSFVFVIPEDQCEQVFLSIWSELSLTLFNFFHYFFPIFPGYPKTITADKGPLLVRCTNHHAQGTNFLLSFPTHRGWVQV